MNGDRLEEVRDIHSTGLAHTGLSPSGVPGIGTNAFTGKDSGCSSKLEIVRTMVSHNWLVLTWRLPKSSRYDPRLSRQDL